MIKIIGLILKERFLLFRVQLCMSQLETQNLDWQCARMIQLTTTLQYILVKLSLYT